MLIDDVVAVIPTRDRHTLLRKSLSQYEGVAKVIVIDNSTVPMKHIPEAVQYHYEPDLQLHELRNYGAELGARDFDFILHIDDDSFFQNSAKGISALKRTLSIDEIWAAGGIGAFAAGFKRRKYGNNPFYISYCCIGYSLMHRSSCPIKFRHPRGDDFIFCFDCWFAGGRVALHPHCIVKHLDYASGGMGEKGWWMKYKAEWMEMFKHHPEVVWTKGELKYLNLKALGITEREIPLEEPLHGKEA